MYLGSSGDSAEITASQKPVQMFGNIDMEDGLLGDHLEQSSLDHKIFKDLLGFPDPLADDSMDSFVDLSCFMGNAMVSFFNCLPSAATFSLCTHVHAHPPPAMFKDSKTKILLQTLVE